MIETKRILLAENSPLDAEMTLAALATRNLANEVVLVADGKEALDYLYARGAFVNRTGGNPALVLLDINMPRIDGLQVLRTIKEDEKLRRIPVVMLTSSREESDLIRSYDHGTNAYVVKPVDFDAFVEAVNRLGIFWTLHNEPPPGTVRPDKPGENTKDAAAQSPSP